MRCSMVSPESEKLALNGPCAVMSVPMRSQSGTRLALRIQVCRSVATGGPGATIGLGAESHRKLPLFNPTSGRKKYSPAGRAIGGLKGTGIETSSPLFMPSPPVKGGGGGLGLIPSTTELLTVKEPIRVDVKLRLPSLLSLVAESISLSAGEFIRVGTVIVRTVLESTGKT